MTNGETRSVQNGKQSDTRPIGIFDSGVGGLTVTAEIMRRLPNENIIYFGDTAHVPYGSKSKEVVTGFSLDIASFLSSRDVKMIVVACNTASAFALPALRRRFDVPVVGVIEPGAKEALSSTYNGRIGIIGTEGTIRSGQYTKAIRRMDKRAKVFSRACPLFVPLIEEGWLEHDVTFRVAGEYLGKLIDEKIDTLVLGCTHYPLIKTVLKKVSHRSPVRLIDSAEETAKEVAGVLRKRGAANEGTTRGSCRFFVSDAPDKFRSVGQRFLGRPIAPVRKVNLETMQRGERE